MTRANSPRMISISSLASVLAFAALAFCPCLASEAPVHHGSSESSDQVHHAPADTKPPALTQPAADWRGVKRDTWYFLGYQAVVVGVLYALPDEQTRFDKSSAGFSKWRENVTNPVWDEDEPYLNYVLHPYWGATYYIRGRERGLSRWQSLGYSALLSTLYEYGAEAFFEPVSYQDLIVTPLVGSLLGEFVFSPVRDFIRSRPGGPDSLGKFVLVLTDPMGAVNELVDRLFGVEAQVNIAPIAMTRMSGLRRDPWATEVFSASRPGSLQPENLHIKNVTWGLRVEVRW